MEEYQRENCSRKYSDYFILVISKDNRREQHPLSSLLQRLQSCGRGGTTAHLTSRSGNSPGVHTSVCLSGVLYGLEQNGAERREPAAFSALFTLARQLCSHSVHGCCQCLPSAASTYSTSQVFTRCSLRIRGFKKKKNSVVLTFVHPRRRLPCWISLPQARC